MRILRILHLSATLSVFILAFLIGATAAVASRIISDYAMGGFDRTKADSAKPVAPKPETTLDSVRDGVQTTDEFDPGGSYSLITEDLNGSFADIASVDLVTRISWTESGTYKNRPMVPDGRLNGTKVSYMFRRIFVGSREISFETEAEDGVSYQFVGHFPVSSEFIKGEGCEHPADLKGKLTKLKNGNAVGEIDADFYAYGRWNVEVKPTSSW